MKRFINQSKGKSAFTLAEVLITLGIIGVVAAMTLPTLIQNHRKSVVETSLKKFYTTINQAVNLSSIENGEPKTWEFNEANTIEGSEQFYNRYFKKYLKILKTDKVSVGSGKYFALYMADGSGVFLGYKASDWYYCLKAKDLVHSTEKNGTGCFKFGFYPSAGISFRNPQSYSARNFANKGVEPFVQDALLDENGEHTYIDGVLIHTTEQDLYEQKCYAKAIQINGWKIPEDYPLKF